MSKTVALNRPSLKPHAYGCRCSQCVGMAAAIGAQNPDGSYFFTDEELFELSKMHERETEVAS